MKKLSILLSVFLVLGVLEITAQRTVEKKVVTTRRGKVKQTTVKNRKGDVVATRTVVKRHPHARYGHHPKRGAVVAKRPVAAAIIKHNRRKYYLENGVYYVRTSAGYRVVRPAWGLRLKILPVGYRRVVVKNRPYFYYYGTYYQQVDGTNDYEVVEAPVQAQVDALPEGYEEVVQDDGTVLYKLDGVYYKEVPLDEDGKEWGYEVVKVEQVPDEVIEDEIMDDSDKDDSDD